MMIFVGILVGLALLIFAALARSITTLFHEMGHAIPALLFSKEEVIIYVGAYETTDQSRLFEFGRLKVFIEFNPFFWNGGLCRHEAIQGFWKRLLVIIGGPIASVIIALPLLYLLVEYQEVKPLLFLTSVYITSAVWDFIVNMIPSRTPIKVGGGAVVYNDGAQLLALILSPKER